jgi:hypothetical protein
MRETRNYCYTLLVIITKITLQSVAESISKEVAKWQKNQFFTSKYQGFKEVNNTTGSSRRLLTHLNLLDEIAGSVFQVARKRGQQLPRERSEPFK